jgi:diacylglycerol kinase (ATP)
MVYAFTDIAIIYNPNSTGDSKKNALALHRRLKKQLPQSVTIELKATKHAGHAEDLARELANRNRKILLVSSSGDGGFNEVINGMISAKNPNAATIVLPSGNANDHHEATSSRTLEDRITHPNVIAVDAIKVIATKDGQPFERYAHSYVGAGLTAHIGKKLTEADLNPFNEKWLVLKYLLLFRSVALRVGSGARWHRYSSIVCGNISRMSKVIKLANEATYDDGKMEVYELRTTSLLKTIASLVFASTLGARPSSQLKKFEMTARRPLEIQLDGEVVRLDANHTIRIEVARSRLRTLQ